MQTYSDGTKYADTAEDARRLVRQATACYVDTKSWTGHDTFEVRTTKASLLEALRGETGKPDMDHAFPATVILHPSGSLRWG